MVRLLCVILAFVRLGSIALAATAPPQLLNKSIVFSWTIQTTGRDTSNGTITQRQTEAQVAIYISSEGRLFERMSRTNEDQQKTLDIAPSTTRNPELGESTNRHFEGNNLVLVRSFPSGASRTVISLDPSFSACTVTFQGGRENGRLNVRKGTDGKTYEILGMKSSRLTCSIRNGNAFAN